MPLTTVRLKALTHAHIGLSRADNFKLLHIYVYNNNKYIAEPLFQSEPMKTARDYIFCGEL